MCCGRCGVALSADAADFDTSGPAHPGEVGLNLDAQPQGLCDRFEDWQLDQSVRSMRARIQPEPTRAGRSVSPPDSRQPSWRVDAAHARPPRHHLPRRRAPARRASGRWPTFTNSSLLLGLAAGTGGAAVLVWSATQARADLWNAGLSAIVAGVVVFALGLVLQLERIWHNGRSAVRRLRRIDAQLQDLERTTSSLSYPHGPASGAFYAHLADGASPHLLVSDLKGQLDLLATNLAHR